MRTLFLKKILKFVKDFVKDLGYWSQSDLTPHACMNNNMAIHGASETYETNTCTYSVYI